MDADVHKEPQVWCLDSPRRLINAAERAEYIIMHSPGGGIIESCQGLSDESGSLFDGEAVQDGSLADVPSGAPCSGVDTSPAPSKAIAPHSPETSLVTAGD